MTILVVGATGATGQLLVQQLLNRGLSVKALVRTPDKLSPGIRNHANLLIIRAAALALSDLEMAQHLDGCDAVVSCLGHTMSFKGFYGHPRMLVSDTTRKLCRAITANKPTRLVKFVLMNTSGNSNRDIAERISFAQQCVIWLLRVLVPPHVDNERAADYLRKRIGQNDGDIQWVAVRPDGLIDESDVSPYEVQASPTRSAIFDAGVTSRINVGHFMAELITDDNLWQKWKGQMPVIYNTILPPTNNSSIP